MAYFAFTLFQWYVYFEREIVCAVNITQSSSKHLVSLSLFSLFDNILQTETSLHNSQIVKTHLLLPCFFQQHILDHQPLVCLVRESS